MDGFEKFTVVVNQEEQYSIWPQEKPLPLGWSEAGKKGDKEECLTYIEAVWTDMRPLSLRQATDSPEDSHRPASTKM